MDMFEHYRRGAQAPLAEAQSLPFAVYRDEAVYQRELHDIFRRDWVFVCAEQALPEPGDYYALELAGESVALVRGDDGRLRALSNNCRHRGTPLLDPGQGRVDKHISCPYHGWAYDHRGALKAVPFSGDVTVDKQAHGLAEFALESWLGLLFINLDPDAQPLAQRLGDIDDYLAVMEPARFDRFAAAPDEHWVANWKLALENAMESYHLFQVHRDTLETVTPTKQAYYVAGSADWTLTGGAMNDTSGKLTKWLRGAYPEAHDHYLLISLPPSFVAILSYDSLGWIQVLPQGPEQTLVRSGYLSDSSLGREDKKSTAFTEAFFAEDKGICERVQRGMHSRHGRGGKLVELERVVVDFHQYLASRLFDSPCSARHVDADAAARFLGD